MDVLRFGAAQPLLMPTEKEGIKRGIKRGRKDMSGKLYKLTAAKLRSIGPGKHSDGGGLYLYKTEAGAQWVFRYFLSGARKEMGLGGYPSVALADARDLADRYRRLHKQGQNPMVVRDEERKALQAEAVANDPRARAAKLLSKIAPEAFEARKSRLKADGKAGRWYSPLESHVLPKLGSMAVDEIHGQDIAKALRPIWHKQPDVSRKAIT
ncbi:integrase arm-type DNA-binding domain-containing protein, partial [Cribrihabitans sp. XS_ASV171]